MMPTNRIAENFFGTLGTVCWTFQLLPQIVKSWREGSTHGLSHWLVLIWGISQVFVGAYAVVENLNIPLIIQPQLFGLFSLVSWGQCLYYGKGHSKLATISMTLAAITFTGVCEVGLVFAIRPSYERGNDIGTLVVGILSSVFIGVGLLPQYWEIYKRREVLGISFLFLFIDMAGGVLNDLSLVFKQTFNILAAITYTLVIVMDGIILVAALLLNPRAARQRKAEVQGRALEENHDSKSDSEITSHVSPAETLETLVNQERTEKVIIKAH
ncbi:hypothetical protein AX14_007399 [Amanita brunnescens Koide BX004]|nr:hypothetical protein AX14_007399 [Amanita brunnescens Koide BX004]